MNIFEHLIFNQKQSHGGVAMLLVASIRTGYDDILSFPCYPWTVQDLLYSKDMFLEESKIVAVLNVRAIYGQE